MRRLRILHLIASIDPQLGGPAAMVLPLARAIARNGDFDVTVAAGVPETGAEKSETSARDVRQVLFPLRPRNTILGRIELSPAFLRWLLANRNTFDLIHSHGVFCVSTASMDLVRSLQGTPFVMRPCGSLSAWGLSQGSRLKAPFLRAITRPTLRRASFVHCTSPNEAADVRLVEPRARALVIPHGLDLGEVRSVGSNRPDCVGERPYVLFIGRLHRVKGLDLLLRAFASLAEGHRDLQLVLAGPDEGMLGELRLLAAELEVSSRVHFTGMVESAEKASLLAHASLFVLPSHHENFGVSALEAAAAGLPLVVTPGVALHPEIEAAGAGVVSAPNPDTLAVAIERVLGPEHDAFADAARALAKRYSLENTANTLMDLYREAVSSRSA